MKRERKIQQTAGRSRRRAKTSARVPRLPASGSRLPIKLSLVISVDETNFDAVAMRGAWMDGVRAAADLGYDGVELAVRDPSQLRFDAVRDAVQSAGLVVPAVGTGQAYLKDGLSLTSEDTAVRHRAIERLRTHVRFAAPLRAAVIVGLLRGRVAGSRDATHRRLLDSLAQVLPEAERLDVPLLFEPINRYETDYLVSVDDVLSLIEQVRSPAARVVVDTFHMNIEEASIEDALRRCGARLGHVHVADSNRQAPGRGHLNFARIIAALREMDYRGHLSAEILPLPDPAGAAKAAVQNLRRFLTARTREGMA